MENTNWGGFRLPQKPSISFWFKNALGNIHHQILSVHSLSHSQWVLLPTPPLSLFKSHNTSANIIKSLEHKHYKPPLKVAAISGPMIWFSATGGQFVICLFAPPAGYWLNYRFVSKNIINTVTISITNHIQYSRAIFNSHKIAKSVCINCHRTSSMLGRSKWVATRAWGNHAVCH